MCESPFTIPVAIGRNFDLDKSGSVDYEEFRIGLKHLGVELSPEDFEWVLDVVDNDKNGEIDYREFVEDMLHVNEQKGGDIGDRDAQKKVTANYRPIAPTVARQLTDSPRTRVPTATVRLGDGL